MNYVALNLQLHCSYLNFFLRLLSDHCQLFHLSAIVGCLIHRLITVVSVIDILIIPCKCTITTILFIHVFILATNIVCCCTGRSMVIVDRCHDVMKFRQNISLIMHRTTLTGYMPIAREVWWTQTSNNKTSDIFIRHRTSVVGRSTITTTNATFLRIHFD